VFAGQQLPCEVDMQLLYYAVVGRERISLFLLKLHDSIFRIQSKANFSYIPNFYYSSGISFLPTEMTPPTPTKADSTTSQPRFIDPDCKSLSPKDFGFLLVPRRLRYDPTKPFHFGPLLNIAFGFASTFSESFGLLSPSLRR
jgi:hypothetical protein